MKRRAALAFGIAITLIVLFVAAVGWEDVFVAARQATLWVYGLAFLASLACLGFRSIVWARVLGVILDRTVSMTLVAGIFLTAMFVKYVTPYGQLASTPGIAAVLPRYMDLSFEEGFATVVSADFLNYLPYYTFGGVGLAYFVLVHTPAGAGLPIDTEYVLAVAMLVAVIASVLAVLWFRRGLIESGLVTILTPLRRLVATVSERRAQALQPENVEERLQGFYTTLDLVSRDRRAMLTALVFAHAGWLGYATALYLTAYAIGEPIPFGLAMLAMALSKFGFLVPAPGGLGGVEIALATVLFLITGMPTATAVATAILFRFATYWFTILVGGLSSILLTVHDPAVT